MSEINWRGWGNEAFEESRQSGKPVLLSISAVWCHWCHVMDQKTYTDQRVIDTINQRFIPVRVDSDRNPDINARYNMGGWPTTAFLTHEKDAITGATYITPKHMVTLLNRVADLYETEQDLIFRRATEAREDYELPQAKSELENEDLRSVDVVRAIIRTNYDSEYGGFGTQQKFPHTDALDLLLLSYQMNKDKDDIKIVTDTLDNMIAGEIFDRVEGGMFRYATNQDWTTPHYEKILEDNAKIASTLLETYRITHKEEYLNIAMAIFSYVENVLMDSDSHMFYGSQDADEEYYQRDALGRFELTAPRVDSAAYTDSNALLALAYIKLWAVTGDNIARDKAVRIVDFFNDLPKGVDGTVCHYYEDGEPRQFGNLSDHALLALANAVCFEATGRQSFLEQAEEMIDAMAVAFGAGSGGFYDISKWHSDERGIDIQMMPMEQNSIAAIAAVMAANLGGEQSYRELAQKALAAQICEYEHYGLASSIFAIALIYAGNEPVVVSINGKPNVSETEDFIRASLDNCGFLCIVKTIPHDHDGQPSATVCVGQECRANISDVPSLVTQVSEAIVSAHERH